MNFPYHTESVSQLIRGKFHENNYTFFNPSLTWLPKSSIPAGWLDQLGIMQTQPIFAGVLTEFGNKNEILATKG